MMLTDAELAKMLKISRDAKIELSLFVGPRAGYDATPPALHAPRGRSSAEASGADRSSSTRSRT